jgi:hypothetical protein
MKEIIIWLILHLILQNSNDLTNFAGFICNTRYNGRIPFQDKSVQDLNPIAKEEFTGGLPRNPHLTLKTLTYIPQNLNAKLKKKPHVVVTPLEKSRLQDDDDYFY